MNFSIVGTNFISDDFVYALSSIKDARAVAVYSRTEERGRYFADKHGIPRFYTDYTEMLSAPDIDAVYIASPIYAHSEQAILAMKSGKHVLCEKMIAHSSAALAEMKKVSEKTGMVLLEAMRPDFDPAYALIREAISQLGKIRRVSLEFCQYSRRYDSFLQGKLPNAFNPEIKNSAISDIGIYPLHTCIRLFGTPNAAFGSSVYLHNGFEGAGAVILQYNDMIATVSYSKISQGVTPSVIEGESGSLTVDKISAPTKIILHQRGEEPKQLDFSPADNNMVYEIEAFLKMCHGKLCAKEYLSASEVCLSIADSILEKKVWYGL